MSCFSRRGFLGNSASALAAGGTAAQSATAQSTAGPHLFNSRFAPVPLQGNGEFSELVKRGFSNRMQEAAEHAPKDSQVFWGIPFEVRRPVLLRGAAHTEDLGNRKADWLVFLHTAETRPIPRNKDGFIEHSVGVGCLGEHAAEYVIEYVDGTSERAAIRHRHQVGAFQRPWGENCFQAVTQGSPTPLRPVHEQRNAIPETHGNWGAGQTRVRTNDSGRWVNWLWAWRNPHPEKEIVRIRFEPKGGGLVLSAVSAGAASDHPLRWTTRRKALLKLPGGVKFDYDIDANGQWKQIRLDMGQVISAQPRPLYPASDWDKTYNNRVPVISEDEVLIEYTAHPDARFYLDGGITVPVSQIERAQTVGPLTPVAPATRRVTIRVIERDSRKPVPVKLHVHGEAGEYLAPVDRHRQPNTAWFEDYAPEFQNQGRHRCTYIPGETVVDLPVGTVYLEVSKGFEIRPVRRRIVVDASTETIEIGIEKVLPWRERGWVTADTHVHFLSPHTAQLEGSAEGVNVVNLLASQWGELMTNVGDFDGKSTFGSREAGGDGEWLVRVGTENRQHVMGHMSLLGYKGPIIAPMCAGGSDEAALGDPVSVLLLEWARQCHKQGGLVVLPHFPNPRAEHAAGLIEGVIDAVEMTSWGNLYGGIDPYSLSDYYRYLNCGHFITAVGGTDKMSATAAVGAVRTYTKLHDGDEFTYENWLRSTREGRTFVTYGPLLEFSVGGKSAGTRIGMTRGGGTIDVTWRLASVTVPMTRVDLIVNGEIRESREVKPDEDSGHWSVRTDRSSWIALLVRGHYPDKPEIIAAHTSPVMIQVDGSEFFSAADAVTILDQIEGALAYVDTVGTRADDEAYKRVRMELTAAHRKLHERLHRAGQYHAHTPVTRHESPDHK